MEPLRNLDGVFISGLPDHYWTRCLSDRSMFQGPQFSLSIGVIQDEPLYTVGTVSSIVESIAVAFDLAGLAFDADVSKMLALTDMEPKGARELCEALEIPQIKCYRRIKELEKLGLLKAIGGNRRNRIYSSNMTSMSISITEDSMVLTTQFKDGGRSNFHMELKWQTSIEDNRS